MPKHPPAPKHLADAGRTLWSQLHDGIIYDAHEVPVVVAACEIADRVSDLRASIDEHGIMVSGSKGQPRLHPAVAEVRQCQVALARLLGQVRPRLGVVDGGQPATAASERARVAAHSRWRRGS